MLDDWVMGNSPYDASAATRWAIEAQDDAEIPCDASYGAFAGSINLSESNQSIITFTICICPTCMYLYM